MKPFPALTPTSPENHVTLNCNVHTQPSIVHSFAISAPLREPFSRVLFSRQAAKGAKHFLPLPSDIIQIEPRRELQRLLAHSSPHRRIPR